MPGVDATPARYIASSKMALARLDGLSGESGSKISATVCFHFKSTPQTFPRGWGCLKNARP
jgi:hypothetical protein